MSRSSVRPSRIEMPEAALDDLHRRLGTVRWPKSVPGEPWQWGTDLDWMREVVEHWRTRFDWRAWEARLNVHEQVFVAPGDEAGGELHTLVSRGAAAAPPLLLLHGWPGSVFELLDVFDTLAAAGHTVVLPSIPGFGFSVQPHLVIDSRQAGVQLHQMMGALGFDRYVVHGGDRGAGIAAWMGLDQPESVLALHLNTSVLRAAWSLEEGAPDDEELAYLQRRDARLRGESAYQAVHAEKGATLGFALRDSPVGLAAWILEKFHGWTDADAPRPRPAPTVYDWDALLANIGAYWFSDTSPVHWMYQRGSGAAETPPGRRVGVPTEFLIFPGDIAEPPPRRWLERTYDVTDVRLAERGGHFPGFEQPGMLAEDVREFTLRYG